jgi:hypothetical protein
MATDSDGEMRPKMSGAGDDPFARKPFQFTLRTLLLLTLVGALFCSAAVTFDGMTRVLAFALILWAVAGAWCCRIWSLKAAVLAYFGGPIYGVILWTGSVKRASVWEHEWRSLLAVGFFVGAMVSMGIVALRRRR